ncbi:hypothetical protein [Nostoc foliaceum]|uniref:hypothetical protein n=1 Tax=Nostoc foliaceum TaxID=2692914 RepID=UPI0016850D08|nr:hypothetical protein [Nostoc foliaceum]
MNQRFSGLQDARGLANATLSLVGTEPTLIAQRKANGMTCVRESTYPYREASYAQLEFLINNF